MISLKQHRLYKRFALLSHSSKAILFIGVFFTSAFFVSGLWKEDRMIIDAPTYYAYLPSAFIYNDLTLHYVDKNPVFFRDKIWFVTIPNGNRVLKVSMGMSLIYAPFFFLGHFYAKIACLPQDGYSLPYQNALSIGVLLYLLLGIYYLREVLLNYFSEKAVVLTLLSITLGTNLFWYSTYEGLMAHSAVFSLFCMAIYAAHKWLESAAGKYFLCFSVLFGLLFLTRQTAILWLLYFLIVGIGVKGGLRGFFIFLKEHIGLVLVGAGIMVFIYVPQAIYWKYMLGKIFYDRTAEDEYFIFKDPVIFKFLFSFQKGWLIYSPIMLFAVIGFVRLYKMERNLFAAIVLPFILFIYVLSCWWCWSYGPAFGMRPMIDCYCFLAFPMTAAYTFFIDGKRIMKYLVYSVVTVLIIFNLFQTWQYRHGLIHFDWMNKEAYFKGLFQTRAGREWKDCLKPYSYERRMKGLSQIEYSKAYFNEINKSDLIYFRGFNFHFLTSANKENILTCNAQNVSNNEVFHLLRLEGDTVAIQTSSGQYLSVKPEMRGIVAADKDNIGLCEKFVFGQITENDNKISLKACNGKYLSTIPQMSNVLCAFSDSVEPIAIFRLFVLDK